jgi:Zn-dependent protease with chaperone function
MRVAACLLLSSFVVAVIAPPLLVRLTRTGAAPRLGVDAWLVTIGSVLASWTLAAAFLAGDLLRDWNQPARIASACVEALRRAASGDSGPLLQAGLLVLSAAGASAVGIVGRRLICGLRTARARTHGHARAARAVGRRVDGLDAVVLDAPERVAYCVAGRPHTIVITSATLDALEDRELDAVLAHEHAHLAGRHHQILAFTRAVAAILPRVALFTVGARDVARLLEMCADDAAARRYGGRTLLDALLAMSGCAPVPPGALGAAGTDVLARARRLALPAPPSLQRRTRLLLGVVTLVLVAAPLVTGVLAAAGLAVCDPLAR